MPSFKTIRRVPFTANQMYALVADVEQYPQFLPLCESLVVKSRRPGEGGEVIVATMGIGYKSIRELFTTQVTLKPAELRIDVAYLDGPFRRLDNRWQFIPAGSRSDIDFFIDYEFRSPFLSLLMSGLFDTAFRRYAQAFEDRAGDVYGRTQDDGASRSV